MLRRERGVSFLVPDGRKLDLFLGVGSHVHAPRAHAFGRTDHRYIRAAHCVLLSDWIHFLDVSFLWLPSVQTIPYSLCEGKKDGLLDWSLFEDCRNTFGICSSLSDDSIESIDKSHMELEHSAPWMRYRCGPPTLRLRIYCSFLCGIKKQAKILHLKVYQVATGCAWRARTPSWNSFLTSFFWLAHWPFNLTSPP